MSSSSSSSDSDGREIKKLRGLIKEQFDEYEAKKRDQKKEAYAFNYKGNEKQAEFITDMLEDLRRLKRFTKNDVSKKAKNLLNSIIDDAETRLKCIKVADRSVAGWNTVKEYLPDDLADDSEDEKKLRKAELRAVTKLKETKRKDTKNSSSSSNNQSRGKEKVSGRPDRQSMPSTSRNTPSSYSYSSSRANHQCFKCLRYGHHRADCTARDSSRYYK